MAIADLADSKKAAGRRCCARPAAVWG